MIPAVPTSTAKVKIHKNNRSRTIATYFQSSLTYNENTNYPTIPIKPSVLSAKKILVISYIWSGTARPLGDTALRIEIPNHRVMCSRYGRNSGLRDRDRPEVWGCLKLRSIFASVAASNRLSPLAADYRPQKHRPTIITIVSIHDSIIFVSVICIPSRHDWLLDANSAPLSTS